MARRWWQRMVVAMAMVIALVLPLQPALAENVNVKIGVGDTTLKVFGYTSPGALVTVLEGGSVIGSITADAAGEFEQTLTSQTPGIRSLQIFSQDTAGRFSDTVTVAANVQEHAETEVEVFLPPIVRILQSQVTVGESIDIEGSTSPNATVVITVDTTYVTVSADNSGLWSYKLATAGLSAGQHWVSAMAVRSGGGQSYTSSQQSFTLVAPATISEPTPPEQSTNPSRPRPRPGATAPSVPIITSPKPGEVVVGDSVEVVGTAEAGAQIEVWNRDVLVGSVFVDAQGNWRLRITLQESANNLKVRACRNTVCSSFSTGLPFFWQPGNGRGPIIWLDTYRLQAHVDQEVRIVATIRGGERPYQLTMDWGDGAKDIRQSANLDAIFAHQYHHAGNYNGHLAVTDKQGRSAIAYFSIHVLPRPADPWWQSPWKLGGVAVALGLAVVLLGRLVIRTRLRRLVAKSAKK